MIFDWPLVLVCPWTVLGLSVSCVRPPSLQIKHTKHQPLKHTKKQTPDNWTGRVLASWRYYSLFVPLCWEKSSIIIL